jgi:hypothetical protein
MAGKGGPTPGAGRKKGVPNKANAGLKAAFQKHETHLVKALIELTKSEDLDIRLKAISLCYDRGWGKAAQPLTGENAEGPAIVQVRHVIIDSDDRAQPGHTNGEDLRVPA